MLLEWRIMTGSELRDTINMLLEWRIMTGSELILLICYWSGE